MDKFIPYTKQSINDDDIAAITEALRSDMITRGKKTEEFEEAIAEYCSAPYAVSFSSCTAGLLAACHVAGVNAYDRIVTTPNTFVATIGAGWHYGASPLFIDIDPTTGNLDLDLLQHNTRFHSSRGRNIYMPVHFAGIPVDMQKLDSMVVSPDDITIEDAAHAIGSSYPSGEKVGSCKWSHMTVFSFHPAKNLTTGEGGIVTTHDKELYHKLKRFRNNGIERDPDHLKGEPKPWYYEVQEVTGNYYMTEMQAALGLSQLKRLDTFATKRRELMAKYRSLLNDVPHVSFLNSGNDSRVMLHLCVVKIDYEACGITREEVMTQLKEKGIGTQVHYIPMYKHPFFLENNPDISEYFPNTELYYSQALSLPLYYDLTEKDVKYVVESLKEILHKKSYSVVE